MSGLVKKIIFTSLFLLLTLNTAQASERVQCPNLFKVRASANLIDKAEYIQFVNAWVAGVSHPAFEDNGYKWYVITSYFPARSADEAIKFAKTVASNLVLQHSVYAKDEGDNIECDYGSLLIIRVSAFKK